MRRTLSGIIALFAFIAAIAVTNLRAADTTRYVCIGNSITYGYGLVTAKRTVQAYPFLLQKMLRSVYLGSTIPVVTDTVFDYGVNSRTLLKEGDYPYWNEAYFASTFTIRPTLISVALGANDTKLPNWTAGGANFAAEYGQMLDSLSHIASAPKLFACLPVTIFSNTFNPPLRDSILPRYIIPQIKSVAAARGIPIIDLHTPTLSKSSLLPDGVHPDSNGHKLLADVFYEAIINSNYITNQAFKIRFLYYGTAPNVTSVTGTAADTTGKPMLYVYPAPDSLRNGAAVLICPGGGYTHVSIDKEGKTIAAWFNQLGVTAFVLRYRYNPYLYPVPINDGKRAMRLVRWLAPQFNLDTTRIGIMGFSAGGHLVSTIATHNDGGNAASLDSIEIKKCRADFNILLYPVITMTGSYVHTGSRDALFGTSPAPSAALLDSFSNQKWVTAQTARTFIAHGGADATVPIQNSQMFDSALIANGVTQKFLVDPGQGHGYGLAGQWPDTLKTWLLAQGILRKTVAVRNSAEPGTAALPFSVSASHAGLRFVSRPGAQASCSIFLPGGRRCASFTVGASGARLWRPPASGIYLVRMSSGGGSMVKMVGFER